MLDFEGQTQYFFGLYEREVQGWLRRFCKESALFIDIGAAEGYYTLFFLKKTSARKVLAFEPLLESRALLSENLRLNRLENDPRLEISPRFVGSHDDPSSCSLDSVCAMISGPCTIKIDVEGAELEILQGARNFLRLPKLFWVIETHSADLERQCSRLLNQAGYRVRIIYNAWWRCFVPEGRPIQHNRWLVAFR